ncbi:MAG: hypothetical protein Q7R96_05220 [Nanoarchaeota archaeon]|nr:hypothetical protein [Nanoarchaeota archaeon]
MVRRTKDSDLVMKIKEAETASVVVSEASPIPELQSLLKGMVFAELAPKEVKGPVYALVALQFAKMLDVDGLGDKERDTLEIAYNNALNAAEYELPP